MHVRVVGEDARVHVGATKNTEGREFPFDVYPELREMLEQQREYTKRIEQERGQIVPWVFHRDTGQRARSLYGSWRSACRRAGHPERIQHDFRRTAVRNLVWAGVPERGAMMLTGHKTRSVFERYKIVSSSDLRDGVRKQARQRFVLDPRQRAAHRCALRVMVASGGYVSSPLLRPWLEARFSRSLRNCFGHVFDGSAHSPSWRTNAHTASKPFLLQTSGLV